MSCFGTHGRQFLHLRLRRLVQIMKHIIPELQNDVIRSCHRPSVINAHKYLYLRMCSSDFPPGVGSGNAGARFEVLVERDKSESFIFVAVLDKAIPVKEKYD